MAKKAVPPPVSEPAVNPRAWETLDQHVNALQQVSHALMHLYEMSFFVEFDGEQETLERFREKLTARAHVLANEVLKWRA